VKALTFLGVSDMVRDFVGVLAIVVGVLNLKDYFFYGSGGFAAEIPQAWRTFFIFPVAQSDESMGGFCDGKCSCLD